MPKCRICGVDKEPCEFHSNKTYKSGYITKCRACAGIYAKEYREANPILLLAKKYKIESSKVSELFEKAEGCQICGDKQNRLVIDHCHTTGKIRGLLCDLCNKGIGQLRDNSEIALKAHGYLKTHGN